jgi:hypothetical protein
MKDRARTQNKGAREKLWVNDSRCFDIEFLARIMDEIDN